MLQHVSSQVKKIIQEKMLFIVKIFLHFTIYMLRSCQAGLGRNTWCEYNKCSQWKGLQTGGISKRNYSPVKNCEPGWFYWSRGNGIWDGNSTAQIKFLRTWVWRNSLLPKINLLFEWFTYIYMHIIRFIWFVFASFTLKFLVCSISLSTSWNFICLMKFVLAV